VTPLPLQMLGISKHFGATIALDQVSLTAQAGEVLALVGENGAGKSTLMKILSGALRPDAGTMRLAGQPYLPQSPQAARTAGVAMIYQELNIAKHLTVEDNVLLGQERRRKGLLDRRAGHRIVEQAMHQLGNPEIDLQMPAGQLSVGKQQLVEIARTLVTNAQVIVLDEPTSSLTQHDAENLFAVIRRLKEAGVAIIYISHFLEEIRQVADRVAVLRDGRSVGEDVLENTSDAKIVSLMVGREVDQLFPKVPHNPGEVLLSLQGFRSFQMPQGVSFDVRRGEILGIAGLVGAGRTELLRSLYALDPVAEGTVKISQNQPPPSPRGRIRAGLGFVSEDRKEEGLAQNQSINDNMTLSRLSPYSRWGWLALRQRREAVQSWADRLQLKRKSVEQPVHSLSGGNQQKVAIARVLHQGADVFLLDEPTRGIDVGTKAEIYRLMSELASQGKAILFVSSYLPELLAICDRIGVMTRGNLCEIRPTEQWTEETIMAHAIDLN